MCCQLFIRFIKKWKIWVPSFLAIIYFILVLTIFPVLVSNSVKNGFQIQDLGALVGGAFVLLAVPISIWQIIQHALHYTKPYLQKHIIRILWMVPIYAINAWLGLLFPENSMYMDSFRECYEAYVIYNFMKFLLNYLNMELIDLEATLERKQPVNHFFPLCCLKSWDMGREFIHMCKHGILQYTVIRPLTTAITAICENFGVYEESDFSGNNAFPYLLAINNASQFIAMYCLVLFYKATKFELRPIKPIGKFLCIKAVVFFSFFQGVIISILVSEGIIANVFDINDKKKLRNISSKLQDFLICIEMFFAALAHHYNFSYEAFVSDLVPKKSCCESFIAMWDISDVHQDISEHFGVVGSSISRRVRGRQNYTLARGIDYFDTNENSRLIDENSAAAVNIIEDKNEASSAYSTARSSNNATIQQSSAGSSTYGSLRSTCESLSVHNNPYDDVSINNIKFKTSKYSKNA